MHAQVTRKAKVITAVALSTQGPQRVYWNHPKDALGQDGLGCLEKRSDGMFERSLAQVFAQTGLWKLVSDLPPISQKYTHGSM